MSMPTKRAFLLLAVCLPSPSAPGQTWTRLTPPAAPAARAFYGMAHQLVSQRTVLFGGYNGTTPLGDTWQWDGTAWTMLNPANRPPARGHIHMAYDQQRGRAVLFGGVLRTSGPGLSDTWEWDGTDWTQARPATVPPGRFGYGLTYDAARGRTVLFSGYPGSGAYADDTWEWDGTDWRDVTPTTRPTSRIYPALAYDWARGRVVLFGGFSFGDLDDTWEWDGSTWTRMTPATRPPARWGHGMTYDLARGRVVMFGGTAQSTSKSDTWEWDGTDWARVPASMRPSLRQGARMVFDSAAGRALLFGGEVWSRQNPSNQTWLYTLMPATYSAYGSGCAGSAGTPALTARSGQLPFIERPFTVELASVPAGAAATLIFGLSDSSWAGTPLPLRLDPFGMPGCDLLASIDVAVPMPFVGGLHEFTLPIPNNVWLVGQTYYNQALVLDPPANPTGVVFSGGRAATMQRY